MLSSNSNLLKRIVINGNSSNILNYGSLSSTSILRSISANTLDTSISLQSYRVAYYHKFVPKDKRKSKYKINLNEIKDNDNVSNESNNNNNDDSDSFSNDDSNIDNKNNSNNNNNSNNKDPLNNLKKLNQKFNTELVRKKTEDGQTLVKRRVGDQYEVVTFNSLTAREKLYALVELDNVEEIMTYFKRHKNLNIANRTKYYNVVLTALKKKMAGEELIEVFNDYKESEEKYSDQNSRTFVYNTVMSYFCEKGDVQRVEQLFKSLPEPTRHSYTILISAYINASMIEKALELLSQSHQHLNVDASAYNMLLSRLADNHQFQMCQAIIDEMMRQGIQLDAISFTTLIPRFAKSKEGNMLNGLLKLLLDSEHIEMDSKLFSSIIEGLASSKFENRAAECVRLYESVPNANKLMDQSCFYHMLSCYPPEKCVSFWNKIARNRPELISRNSVSRFAKILLQLPESSTKIMELFNYAKQKFPFAFDNKDPYFYNILILSMLREKKVAEAWAIFQFLTRQKQANSETYYPIIKYLTTCASSQTAFNSCREILNSSHFRMIKIDHFPFWRSIFQALIDADDYTNLVPTIDLFKSCTTNHISPFIDQLHPYLVSKDQKAADYILSMKH